jgi:hypothetical protein
MKRPPASAKTIISKSPEPEPLFLVPRLMCFYFLSPNRSENLYLGERERDLAKKRGDERKKELRALPRQLMWS